MSRVRNSSRRLVELAVAMRVHLYYFFEAASPNMIIAANMWRDFLERLEHQRVKEKTRNPEAYIRRVASAVVADWDRSKGARIPPKRAIGGGGSISASTRAEITSELQRRLRKTRVHRLSLQRRLSFTWGVLVGLSYKCAALAMGIKSSTVSSHIRDARRILRQLEEEEGPDES